MEGGISDLYVINADGTGLRQLTRDKYAQLMPAWSPDGHTIAYVTDEGPGTDFTELSYGNFRIALFDLDLGRRELLPHMDEGRNVSPQWAPDGQSFAFVSDRTGIANVFLYELGGDIYQLTNLYTGRAVHHAALPRPQLGAGRPTGSRSCTSRTRTTTSTPSRTRAR